MSLYHGGCQVDDQGQHHQDGGDGDGVPVLESAAESSASGHNVDIVDILGKERYLGTEEDDKPRYMQIDHE